MATHVKFVHDFVTSVKKAIQLQNIGNGDAITNYALGTEGYRDGVEAETAKTGLNLFEDAVSSTITGVLGCEEYKSMGLLDSQRKAAILVGKLCASPSIALQNLDKLRDPVLLSGERMIGAEEYGVDDAIDPADVMANLGIESYDGQKLQNAIYYSIAYNLGAARQDAFGEAFFPTITIDPTVSGFTIELEFASLIPEFLRERNGNPDNPKFNRIPVIKSIYDHSIHTTDKNKCIPVFENSENADVLIADLKHVDTSTTREITTAPIKFGKTVSLLGLSQDDYLLSTGVMDMTDSLDRTVTLDKIYYSLNKDAEETFAADMSIYPHNGFIANPLEHHKDVILNFNAGRVVIPVSTIKNAKGTASEQWKKGGVLTLEQNLLQKIKDTSAQIDNLALEISEDNDTMFDSIFSNMQNQINAAKASAEQATSVTLSFTVPLKSSGTGAWSTTSDSKTQVVLSIANKFTSDKQPMIICKDINNDDYGNIESISFDTNSITIIMSKENSKVINLFAFYPQ